MKLKPVEFYTSPINEPSFNIDEIRIWITALRSGKYQQTKNQLHNHAGYCCLGVLYESLGNEWRRQDTNIMKTSCGSTGIWGDQIIGEQLADALAAANDEGATFKEIADWLENVFLPAIS